MDSDTAPQRRFALATGWILLLYTIAGVEIESPARFTLLWFQFIIKSPQIIGWGLLLTTAYAAARYYWYVIRLKMVPWRARKMIKRGTLPEQLPGRESVDVEVPAMVSKYFPGINRDNWEYKCETGYLHGLKILRVPWRTKVAIWLENVDVVFPLVVSCFALIVFLILAMNRMLRAMIVQL